MSWPWPLSKFTSVFIRIRSEDDIKFANSVDEGTMCDPEDDAVRVEYPEWLIVVGVCTHIGCILLPNAWGFVVFSVHALVLTTTFQAGFERANHQRTRSTYYYYFWRITSFFMLLGF
ncbi:hypothetical protein MKW98_032357 [Papaver atlanticum]|uniref:Uncharacterized protein n=1 Tax=Papaver atlanticum TaxID=357466 RepID=A0AAD4SER2_9MAGN|nr:hypothetical protein MKW98_032357 [Papaver atlanticum]